MTETTGERPHRSRRIEPSPEERALADQIAHRAMQLRDSADADGLSVREAIQLALIQMGLN